jgi:hypothetical protein
MPHYRAENAQLPDVFRPRADQLAVVPGALSSISL